jgi:hypothetical protein
MPPDVIVESLGVRRAEEGDCSRALVSPYEDIQKHATTHRIRDIRMRGAVRQVAKLNRAGTLPLKLWPLARRLGVVGAGRTFDMRLSVAHSILIVFVFVYIGIGIGPRGALVIPTVRGVV